MSFCLRVIKSRVKLGLTQEELAKKIGVKRVTVNSWENPQHDENYPNSINLEKLAKALDVDPSWLRFGDKSTNHFQPKDYIHENEVNILVHGSQVLSMSQIGAWLKSNSSLIKKGVFDMSALEKKKAMFPVLVENDAMVSTKSLEKNLLIGDIVWVNAVFDKIKSGDIVCAKFGKSDDYKFRCYYRDGAEEILSATNEKYPNTIVDDNVMIVGIVNRVIRCI